MEIFDIGRFWRWWRAELATLLPAADPRRAASRRAAAEVHIGSDMVGLYRRSNLSTRLATPAGLWPTIDDMRGRLKPGESVVLSLDASHCLIRRRQIPAGAFAETDNILALDIARTTPFFAAGVISGWYPDGPRQKDDSRPIRHVVIRKDLLAAAFDKLKTLGVRCTAIGVRPANQPALPVLFASDGERFGRKQETRWKRACLIAGGAAVSLAVTATAYAFYRQQQELTGLHQSVAELQTAAVAVRKQVETRLDRQRQAASIAALRRRSVSTVAVWEELSRLIPDSAWLQALAIGRDGLLIEGRAAAAEELIPALEASPMFANVRFASPVYKAAADASQSFSIKFDMEREAP